MSFPSLKDQQPPLTYIYIYIYIYMYVYVCVCVCVFEYILMNDAFIYRPGGFENQSVSGVTTICLTQCNTSPSHRVDQVVDCVMLVHFSSMAV